MALLHAATLNPTKAEIISAWLPAQSWTPGGEGPIELVGAYRFDDPEGQVGIEGHLVRWSGESLHVPLTYRGDPLDGADAHLLGTMQHSALGQRWVYDGLGDPVFVRMLAATAMTGCGQAVGMVEHEGRWVLAPPTVCLSGGRWTNERVAIDRLDPAGDDDGWVMLRNDRFEVRVARRPQPGERPPIGLTATWSGQAHPMVLAEVRDHRAG